MFDIEDFVIVNRGLKREVNQDNIYVNGFSLPLHNDGFDNYQKKINSSSDTLIYGVFDGVGGLINGEVSSFKATHNIDLKKGVSSFLKEANHAIIKNNQEEKMASGSTASIITIKGHKLNTYEVGDSPIIIYSKGHLEKVLDEKNPKLLNNYLGKDKDLKITTNIYRLHHNDRIIICSDGLTNNVLEKDILKIISSSKDASYITQKLLNLALLNGGNDNISIITLVVKRNYYMLVLFSIMLLLILIIIVQIVILLSI